MKKCDRIKNVLNYVKSEKGIQIARIKPNAFVRNSPLNIENYEQNQLMIPME